ncbi:hypothetical protein [Deinococcus sp. UYEF24]
MKRLFYLLALPLFLLDLTLAQTDTPVIVPDSVWYLAATVIGVFVTWIASPLTELLKGRFRFQGNVTQLIYLVLRQTQANLRRWRCCPPQHHRDGRAADPAPARQPGTEPLHDLDGKVIGAVMPLTPTRTGLEIL